MPLTDFATVIPGIGGRGEDGKKDGEGDLLLKEKATLPTGLLVMRVFGCTNLYLDKDVIPDLFGVYVNITIGCLSKCTSVKSCYKKGKVIWDEVKNFSIPVPDKVSSSLNKVHIAVIGFDKQQIRPKFKLMGKIEFHLHKIVTKQWSMDSFELQNKKKRYAGDISIEFAFAYGAFGYGMSEQLESVHSPNSMIDQSAFPRLDPQGTTLHTLGVSSIPRKVTHPKFIPFSTKVLNLEPDISPTYGLRTFPHDLFKTRQALDQKMTRLKGLCAEYSKMGSRVKKIGYIKKMMSEKETKLVTLNEIAQQDSDSDQDSKSSVGEETAVGLTGALAQMADMSFLPSAPGIRMRNRNRNPKIVQSSSTINEENDKGENQENLEPAENLSDDLTVGDGHPGLLERLRAMNKRSSQVQTENIHESHQEPVDTIPQHTPEVTFAGGLGAKIGLRPGNTQGQEQLQKETDGAEGPAAS